MAAQLKTCACGKSGLLWRRLDAKRWALYEVDDKGRPVRNHTDICPQFGATNGKTRNESAIETESAAVSDWVEAQAAKVANASAKVEAEAEADDVSREVASGAIPAIDSAYTVDLADWAAIKRVIAEADSTGMAQNMGFYGPAGSGKTTLAVQVGAFRRSHTVVVDSTDRESAADWFGTSTLKDGTLTVEPSDFVTAIETPGATVILDDVAYVTSRTVNNGLSALLDPSRRSIYVQSLGREVRVAAGVLLIGTWNVGAEYNGATDLSMHLVDRFRSGALFEVPYPDDSVLSSIIQKRTGVPSGVADRLADVTSWLRSDPEPFEVSTRSLLAAAKQVANGATIGAALFYTVFGELDIRERQRAYGIILTQCSKAGYPESEQSLWEAPRKGNYGGIA